MDEQEEQLRRVLDMLSEDQSAQDRCHHRINTYFAQSSGAYSPEIWLN